MFAILKPICNVLSPNVGADSLCMFAILTWQVAPGRPCIGVGLPAILTKMFGVSKESRDHGIGVVSHFQRILRLHDGLSAVSRICLRFPESLESRTVYVYSLGKAV